MAIYIVQHGLSLPGNIDPEKGLSEDGKRETALIAGVAKDYGVQVSKILHSGKKRAKQTAAILDSYLSPAEGFQKAVGMKPLDDTILFSKGIRIDQNVMLVGHLPFLEKFLSFIVTGDPDQPIFKLQNSGICCLNKADPHETIVIKWALMPNIS